IIGASILKTIMPVLIPFLAALTDPVILATMEDIGRIVGIILIPALMAFTFTLNLMIPIIKVVTNFLANIGGVLRVVGNGFIWFINVIIGGINSLLKLITFGAWKNIPRIPSLQGGIKSVPQTGLYILHKREEVIPANRRDRKSSGITIHIHMDNSIIDNRDKLVQDIAEQVWMRIG
ncbi:hypothetical protein LCGC14_2175140, partial [marine sediment metagenome]